MMLKPEMYRGHRIQIRKSVPDRFGAVTYEIFVDGINFGNAGGRIKDEAIFFARDLIDVMDKLDVGDDAIHLGVQSLGRSGKCKVISKKLEKIGGMQYKVRFEDKSEGWFSASELEKIDPKGVTGLMPIITHFEYKGVNVKIAKKDDGWYRIFLENTYAFDTPPTENPNEAVRKYIDKKI